MDQDQAAPLDLSLHMGQIHCKQTGLLHKLYPIRPLV